MSHPTSNNQTTIKADSSAGAGPPTHHPQLHNHKDNPQGNPPDERAVGPRGTGFVKPGSQPSTINCPSAEQPSTHQTSRPSGVNHFMCPCPVVVVFVETLPSRHVVSVQGHIESHTAATWLKPGDINV